MEGYEGRGASGRCYESCTTAISHRNLNTSIPKCTLDVASSLQNQLQSGGKREILHGCDKGWSLPVLVHCDFSPTRLDIGSGWRRLNRLLVATLRATTVVQPIALYGPLIYLIEL